jgi:hypothetical protein
MEGEVKRPGAGVETPAPGFSSGRKRVPVRRYFAVPDGAGAGLAGAGALDGGAEPVVAAGAGALLLAVLGPGPAVPAHHQIPSPIRMTMMMPMIQPPPELPDVVRGRLLGS